MGLFLSKLLSKVRAGGEWDLPWYKVRRWREVIDLSLVAKSNSEL